MVSFWIDFGTNYIGGTGATQSEAAWRIALALQLVPAIILGIGILFMPFSPRYAFLELLSIWYIIDRQNLPRWLVNNGRDDQALQVLSRARRQASDSDLVQIEFLEIKAQYLFEKETAALKYPDLQDGSWWSNFKLGFYDYLSLLCYKRTYTTQLFVSA